MGTAAAYCIKHDLAPRELATDKKRVEELQQILLRDDQTIRHRRNLDPLDLAPKAEVTCSASNSEGEPENVINGFVRDFPKKWENRCGIELAGKSEYLQLEWKMPVKLTQIQITFDTGFERLLTLSHQDSVNAKMIRAPQPETVRDYELLYRAPEEKEWTRLIKVAGNYQRLRRHQFEPCTAAALRLVFYATNGSKLASVYEIRCYA